MTEASPTLPQQVVRFLVSGVAASGTHYAVYAALVAAAVLSPVSGTVVGFCVGTLVSYVLNARFTFRGETGPRTFAKFWIVTLVGGALNTGLVGAFVHAGVHWAPSGLVAIAAGATFNFVGHRAWTFRRSDP